jgi:hypothetical protein
MSLCTFYINFSEAKGPQGKSLSIPEVNEAIKDEKGINVEYF